MSNKASDLRLIKWYLDCITASGDALIGYVAFLQWKRLKVSYSSTIFLNEDSKVEVDTSLTRSVLPNIDGNQLFWKDETLRIEGFWQRDLEPIEATLHKGHSGALQWHCYQPRSRVKINYNNRKLEGFGYAEMLELTDKPWNIDMSSLRWGRFCSERDSIVWIQINGSAERNWAWYNGHSVNEPIITDHSITLPELKIVLDIYQSRIIEAERKILNTVMKLVKYLPGFDKQIPYKFLYADETKWRSRGVIQKDGSIHSEGWVIHELVDFNK